MVSSFDHLITHQNIWQVTRFLMNLDTAMIEERYHTMGVRQLLEEHAKLAQRAVLTSVEIEEIPFFPPIMDWQNTACLKTLAIQLTKLLTKEGKERLAKYLYSTQSANIQ